MQNTNNIVPPIAQLSYSMVESLIQKVVQEELEKAVREELATHNMTGEKGFLRNVVAKDIINAYLGIKKPLKNNADLEDKDEKSLFSIMSKENTDNDK